jgi:hypothetical protein
MLTEMALPGRRLSSFCWEWKKKGASPSLLSWIGNGYHIPLRHDRPIDLCLPSREVETRMSSPHKQQLIRTEVKSLLSKGAIQEVHGDKWGFYSKLFLVPKPTVEGSKKWRPVINLKPLNYHIEKEKFSSETVKSVKEEIQTQDWGASIDMTDVS